MRRRSRQRMRKAAGERGGGERGGGEIGGGGEGDSTPLDQPTS